MLYPVSANRLKYRIFVGTENFSMQPRRCEMLGHYMRSIRKNFGLKEKWFN